MKSKDEDLSRIAERIRKVRGGMRQEDFAAALLYEQSTVSRWERGVSRPVPEAFTRIAKHASAWEDKLFFLDLAGLPEEYLMGKPMLPEIKEAASKVVASITGPSLSQKVVRTTIEEEPLAFDRELMFLILKTAHDVLTETGEEIAGEEFAQRVLRYYDECHGAGIRNPAKVVALLRSA